MPSWSSAMERGWVVATKAGAASGGRAHYRASQAEPIAEIPGEAGENGLSSVRPAYLSACIAKSGLLSKYSKKIEIDRFMHLLNL